MNVIVPMAGPDTEFRKKFGVIKMLTEVGGQPLVEHVVSNLLSIGEDARFVFVIRRADARKHHLDAILRLLVPEAKIVFAERETAGAACSTLLASPYIEDERPLVVANGDQLIFRDLGKEIKEFQSRDLDGGLLVFHAVNPRWSFVRLNSEGFVIEAAEKRPISNLATAGLYYFRRGGDFTEGAKNQMRKQQSVEGGYFVCPVYNELILAQKQVGCTLIDKEEYYSLSSTRRVRYYEETLLEMKRNHAGQ